MVKKVGILGAGSFSREVYCYLEQHFSKLSVVDYVDIKCFSEIQSTIFYGPTHNTLLSDREYVCGVSDPLLKQKFYDLGPILHEPILMHSFCGRGVRIGYGSIVCPGSILTTNIFIGIMATINLNCTIGHDVVIGDFFNSAPGVNISGKVSIGNRVSIGTNACIREGISICDDVTVGMGAVVVKDITEPGVYIGSPARKKI